MKILVVEDDDFKFSDILATISPRATSVLRASSVQAGYGLILSGHFDLVVLDMALPSHDLVAGAGNPYPQPVGGIELLLELADQGRSERVIILTQYPSIEFNRKFVPLRDFPSAARAEGIELVVGCILFALDGKWRREMGQIMEAIA